MKRHLLAALLVLPAVSAFAETYNGALAEVSADPRDGNDVIAGDHTYARALELVGMNDTVDLHELRVQFDSGLVIKPLCRDEIRPGEHVIIDLPRNAGTIAAIELDYGRPELRRRDRTDARLQIFALGGQRHYLSRASTSSWGGVVTSGPLGARYTETSLRTPNWPGK